MYIQDGNQKNNLELHKKKQQRIKQQLTQQQLQDLDGVQKEEVKILQEQVEKMLDLLLVMSMEEKLMDTMKPQKNQTIINMAEGLGTATDYL